MWPIDPSPPGWIHENGRGGGSDDGGGDGDICNPDADWPPCTEFKAKLSCPIEIRRGDFGNCVVAVPGQAFTVSKWHFRGDDVIQSEWESSSKSWEGTLVESGEVQVDILIEESIPVSAVSRIQVVPRRSGKFTDPAWKASMSFVKGKGKLGCGGKRPHIGGTLGWSGSFRSHQELNKCHGLMIDPWTEAGYQVEHIESGPNGGGIYIKNPFWYYKGTSQIHPGRDRRYALEVPEQARECRDAGVTGGVSFNVFNHTCKEVPGWKDHFWAAVWAHEKQHWEDGREELNKSQNNLYIETEHCIGDEDNGYEDFDACVIEVHEDVAENLSAATEHDGGYDLWNTTPVWVWRSDCCADNSFGPTNLTF